MIPTTPSAMLAPPPRLKLRPELTFAAQRHGADVCYIVEDPVNSRFYRVGQREYALMTLLDGQRTVPEAMQTLAGQRPDLAFAPDELIAFCQWLLSHQFVRSMAACQSGAIAKAPDEFKLPKLSPLSFKVPLFNPDPLLTRLVPWLGRLFSPLALAAWFVVAIVALVHLVRNWDRVAESTAGILAPDNWLWLAAAWGVLKVVHETAHGIACKRHGGSVRQAGLCFVLFAPLAYVDVTASWRFRSRWARIETAAAGMYAELFIAALATIFWANRESGIVGHVAFNLMTMASVATVLFNANPLMRFDGYYILSDWLGIPNLSLIGRQYTDYLWTRHVLGMPASAPALPKGRAWIARGYGIAATVWQTLSTLSLTIAASTLFRGAGIVLAVAAAAGWLGMPLLRFARKMIHGKPGERPDRWRVGALLLGAAVLAVLAIFVIPWPAARRAPALVEYSPLEPVRAECPGFVREMCVHDGQFVRAGDVLAVLENPQLACELRDLEIAVEQSRQKGRSYQQHAQIGAYQVEAETRLSLQRKVDEKRRQVGSLTLHAPCDGNVIQRNLEAWLGCYLKKGQELLAIGKPHQKELRISVSQDDVESFREQSGRDLRVRLRGSPSFRCRLARVEPRGSLQPPDAALGAQAGGPVPVREKREGGRGDGSSQVEFLAPRFTAIATLSEQQSEHFSAGQLGTVSLRVHDEPIGEHLYRVITRWVRSKLRGQE